MALFGAVKMYIKIPHPRYPLLAAVKIEANVSISVLLFIGFRDVYTATDVT